jgi:tetratricopeptide (TPR) repeat protein
MSPEQARGNTVDGRSDLFSLGCILYECLIGEKPFLGGSVTGVLLRIVSDDPVPPVDWKNRGLPTELDTLMKRVLAKDPSERYPSGARLIEALRHLASDGPIEARETGVRDVEALSPTSHTEPKSSSDSEEVRSTKREGQTGTPSKEPSFIEALQEEERALCFSTEDPNTIQNLNLSPDDAYIVSRIDGISKPRDIFAVSPLSQKETARTLLGLIEAEIIKFQKTDTRSGIVKKLEPEKKQAVKKTEVVKKRDAAVAKPIDEATKAQIREIDRSYDLARFQDHAQFLGIPRNSGRDEIKRAFQEKSARYNPNNYSKIYDPDFHNKLRHLLKLAYEAYTALSKRLDNAPSPEPDSAALPAEEATADEEPRPKKEDPQGAEEIYLRAEKAYEMQDYWTTIELCRHAIDTSSREAEYHHLLGLALLENENWRKEAEESLQRATELDPDNPKYLELLGSLYQEAGFSSRAKKMFDKAKSTSSG